MKPIESEKHLERLLKRTVEQELNGLCLKLSALHISGLPDRMCLIPGGRIFFAEIKTTHKKPRKIQLFMHRKLRELGFRVLVIDMAVQIKNIAREYGNNSIK